VAALKGEGTRIRIEGRGMPSKKKIIIGWVTHFKNTSLRYKIG
jgi:hypothetical protein